MVPSRWRISPTHDKIIGAGADIGTGNRGWGRAVYAGVVRWFICVLVLLGACVERRLHIRTDPPGALVRVNGKEVGHAPTTWSFDHYGKVRVEAELPDHEPVQQVVELVAPTREWVFAGFFTDVLWPGTIHEDHEVALRLPRVARRTEEQIAREVAGLSERAVRVRSEAERR